MGYPLVAASGIGRERSIRMAERANKLPRQMPPSLSLAVNAKRDTRLLRHARGLYGASSVVGTVGATAAGVGTYRAFQNRNHFRRKEVIKSASPVDFVRDGVKGAVDANTERAKISSKTPAQARPYMIAGGAAGGGLGSLAMHRGLDKFRPKIKGHSRAALAAMAGVAGATSVMPVTNAVMRRRHPEWKMTPTGVHVEKAMSDKRKHAAVYTAGAAPVVASVGAGLAAAHMAPKGHKVSSGTRTWAGQAGGATVGGIAGAYGSAALARRSPSYAAGTQKVERAVGRASSYARSKIGLKPASSVSRAMRLASSVKVAKPLLEHPAAAAVGFTAARAAGGAAGNYLGYSDALKHERVSKGIGSLRYVPHVSPKQVAGYTAAGVLAGESALYGAKGRHDRAKSKPSHSRASDAVAGAAAGGFGAQAINGTGGFLAKKKIGAYRAKAYQQATGSQRKRWDKTWRGHLREHGLGVHDPIVQAPEHVKEHLYRHYPTDLPGGKAQRALAAVSSRQATRRIAGVGALAGAALAVGPYRHHVNKADTPQTLRSRKRHQAAYSTASAASGLTALTAMGAKHLHGLKAHNARLSALQVGALTTGAGIGAVGNINFARINRQEAKQPLSKAQEAWVGVVAKELNPGSLARTAGYRSSYLRAVRKPTGLTVRTRVKATVAS